MAFPYTFGNSDFDDSVLSGNVDYDVDMSDNFMASTTPTNASYSWPPAQNTFAIPNHQNTSTMPVQNHFVGALQSASTTASSSAVFPSYSTVLSRPTYQHTTLHYPNHFQYGSLTAPAPFSVASRSEMAGGPAVYNQENEILKARLKEMEAQMKYQTDDLTCLQERDRLRQLEQGYASAAPITLPTFAGLIPLETTPGSPDKTTPPFSLKQLPTHGDMQHGMHEHMDNVLYGSGHSQLGSAYPDAISRTEGQPVSTQITSTLVSASVTTPAPDLAPDNSAGSNAIPALKKYRSPPDADFLTKDINKVLTVADFPDYLYRGCTNRGNNDWLLLQGPEFAYWANDENFGGVNEYKGLERNEIRKLAAAQKIPCNGTFIFRMYKPALRRKIHQGQWW